MVRKKEFYLKEGGLILINAFYFPVRVDKTLPQKRRRGARGFDSNAHFNVILEEVIASPTSL